MKKVYLSIFIAGLTASSAMGQIKQRQYSFDADASTKESNKVPAATTKALGITLWSDDFSDDLDWTIGAPNLQGEWEMVSTTPADLNTYMGAMNSTTDANGFGAFNGVQFLLSASVDAQDAILMSHDTLDLTGYPDVKFSFEQRYRAFNTDETWVEFSTDAGTSWTGVQFNTGVVTNDPAVQNLLSENVSAIIGGQDSVMVRFRWINPSSDDQFGSGYGWMVDDAKIETLPDNDIAIASSYWGSVGLHYYQIPTTQVAPIEFTSTVTNEGDVTQTDVVLNVSVDGGGTFTGTSPLGVDIAPGAGDSLVLSSLYTPAATVGTHNIVWGVSQNETDDIPANNVNSNIAFDVTNFIYARDNNVISGSTTNGTDGFEAGNLFDIWNDQTIKAINVRLPSGAQGATVGTEIFAKIYSIDPGTGDFVWEGETNPLVLAASNLNVNLVMELIDPVNLLADNTYLAVVGSFGPGLKVSNAGSSEPQTSFFLDMADGTWYYQTSTPYVRLNFDPSVGIEENEAAVNIGNVFPNPTSGESKFNYTLANASDVVVEIVDVTGKTVYTVNHGTQTAGSHEMTFNAASFSNGVYYVKISTDEATATKKFIKK